MLCQIPLEDGFFLVKLARKAVETYIKEGKIIEIPKDSPEKYMKHFGVFVTISSIKRCRKELRGCIGFPYPTKPLIKAVIEAAINSAVQDPRFLPVSVEELGHIVFEVSVLTPPKLIEVDNITDLPSKIRVGKDGLIIERGYYKGLLLPQVPVEWNWDKEEFLCQCCIKAGLSPDSWLIKGTKVYSFQAQIFHEINPRGQVKRILK